MIIYIHGFNSSSASVKARLLGEHLRLFGHANKFLAPDLPHQPRLAMEKLEFELRRHDARTITLVGSSLGGHYATWLAEKHDLRAVLINPAVNPHLLLAPAIGPQKNLYTGEKYQFTPQHLAELESYNIVTITCPDRYLLLVQSGDEVLDYRDAVQKYRCAQQVVIDGGDHGFRNFSDLIPRILEFAGEQAGARLRV
jgi:predicted esterase YcpF (UPF0227 family)